LEAVPVLSIPIRVLRKWIEWESRKSTKASLKFYYCFFDSGRFLQIDRHREPPSMANQRLESGSGL
jgi:hypothetical protein